MGFSTDLIFSKCIQCIGNAIETLLHLCSMQIPAREVFATEIARRHSVCFLLYLHEIFLIIVNDIPDIRQRVEYRSVVRTSLLRDSVLKFDDAHFPFVIVSITFWHIHNTLGILQQLT